MNCPSAAPDPSGSVRRHHSAAAVRRRSSPGTHKGARQASRMDRPAVPCWRRTAPRSVHSKTTEVRHYRHGVIVVEALVTASGRDQCCRPTAPAPAAPVPGQDGCRPVQAGLRSVGLHPAARGTGPAKPAQPQPLPAWRKRPETIALPARPPYWFFANQEGSGARGVGPADGAAQPGWLARVAPRHVPHRDESVFLLRLPRM